MSVGNSVVNRISQINSGNMELSNAASDARSAIENAGGVLKPGSTVNVSGLTSSQVSALVSEGSAMVSATASGDIVIKSAVDSVLPVIKGIGGDVIRDSDINTADDWTVSGIASVVISETDTLSRVASADSQISAAVDRNKGTISNAGGVLAPGSTVDTSDLTPEQINSLAAAYQSMVDATGSGDAAILSIVNSARSAIEANGGHLVKGSNINTADSMTGSEIASGVASHSANISQTASADAKISGAVSENYSDVYNAAGILSAGSEIDTSGMTSEAVASIAAHQKAMVDATGSADSYVTSTTALAGSVDAMNAEYQRLASQIVAHGGTVDWQSGAVNITNPSQVTSDPDLTRGLSVQASEEAVSQAASSAVTAINGIASSAAAHSVSAMVGRTIEVHNQSEVDSVVAQNKALVDSVIAKVGSVMAVQNTYPTNYSGQFVPSGSMDSLNWKGANNNIDGKGTTITIRNAGDMGSYQSAGRNMLILTGAYDNSHIVQHLSWDSPNQISLVSGSLQGGSVGGYRDSNWDGSSAIYHITSGTTIKIAGGARMMDGTTRDVYVRIWNANAANNLLTIYNKDGSISAATAGPHLKNMATIGMQFWIGSQNSNEQFIMGDFLSDIDGGQMQSLSNSYLLGLGGGLCAWGDPGQGHTMNVGADWNLGVTYGNNHDPHGLLHGLDSYPDGCALTVSYGNGFVYTISNNNSPTVSGIAVSYFGDASVQSTVVNRAVNLAKPVYNYQPVTVHPKHLATTVTPLTMTYQAMSLKNVPQKLALGVNGIETDYNGMSTKYTPVSVKYAAYDTTITDHYRNTYTPLKTSYKAIDNVATPLDLAAGQVVDHGGLHKLDTGYHPLSTSFMSASDYDYQTPDGKTHRGYGPLSATYNPLATTYANFSSDGKAMGKDGKLLNPYLTDEHGHYILDQNGHRILNPKFTGYTPLSTDYPIYSSDGTKIPPMISDPNHPGNMIPNPRFTGYAPMSVHYQVLSSDGTKVPSTIDGKPNPHFTGYAPIKDTYPLLVDREQPQPRPVLTAPQPQPGVAPAPQPAPVQSVIVPASQPAPQPQPQPALPQMNGADEAALVALGLAMASMGMVLLKKNKREIR